VNCAQSMVTTIVSDCETKTMVQLNCAYDMVLHFSLTNAIPPYLSLFLDILVTIVWT